MTSFMRFKYRNDTDHAVIYRDRVWQRGEELEVPYIVPSSLGLTCTQEGSAPDPVLYHGDIVINAGEERIIEISEPTLSHKVYLSILAVSGGVECRFNSADNKPMPIDERSFVQKIDWSLCSKIYLKSILGTSVQISITAVEVY